MPAVSVIMGIFNCEETLEKSIKSIIDQTYTDWELILCDDCSVDNTYRTAETFAEQYRNIILLKNEQNMGLAYTLNKCSKYAKGDYLARMDGDDVCLTERFQEQVDFLNNNEEYSLVGSSAVLYDETGDKAVRRNKEFPNQYDLIHSTPFVHPSIMIRKTAFDIINGYTVSKRTKRGQDTDLWFKFYAQGFKGYNIQKPLIKYKESITDYKKRSFKVRWRGMKTRFIGYKRLGLPAKYYIFALKPVIAGLIPKKVMYFYHKSIKGYKI